MLKLNFVSLSVASFIFINSMAGPLIKFKEDASVSVDIFLEMLAGISHIQKDNISILKEYFSEEAFPQSLTWQSIQEKIVEGAQLLGF